MKYIPLVLLVAFAVFSVLVSTPHTTAQGEATFTYTPGPSCTPPSCKVGEHRVCSPPFTGCNCLCVPNGTPSPTSTATAKVTLTSTPTFTPQYQPTYTHQPTCTPPSCPPGGHIVCTPRPEWGCGCRCILDVTPAPDSFLRLPMICR